MTIESDAQNDLALDDEDAENVVGGLSPKKHKKVEVAEKSILVNMPAMGASSDPGVGPGMSAAELSSDPDC